GLQIRKYAILVHRWLGVVFCVLFAVWFVSGIVMMYWGYPKVSPEMLFEKSAALDASLVRVSPVQAYAAIKTPEPPDQVRITMIDGRPVYRFSYGRWQSLIYADDGQLLPHIPSEMALRIASNWTNQPTSSAAFEGLITEDDQWTVNPSVRPFGPFWKYS